MYNNIKNIFITEKDDYEYILKNGICPNCDNHLEEYDHTGETRCYDCRIILFNESKITIN